MTFDVLLRSEQQFSDTMEKVDEPSEAMFMYPIMGWIIAAVA